MNIVFGENAIEVVQQAPSNMMQPLQQRTKSTYLSKQRKR